MEVDAAYANLFGTEGKAAVLGCDEIGLVPRDLLHRPKKLFKRAGDDKNAVLVRYTLTERARQNNIRKVLAIKNRLIVEGEVHQKWKERCKLFPDAPGVPKIPKAVMEKLLAELDTETEDDDAIDELGLVRPIPQYGGAQEAGTPQQPPVADGGEGTASNAAPLALESSQSTPRRSSGRGTSVVSDRLASASKREASAKGLYTHVLRQFRTKHANDAADGGQFALSRKSSGSGVSRRPRPPPDPPFLPPVSYPCRDSATLKLELEELDEYRRFLLRYAHDSSAMAQEYSDFTRSLRKANEAEGAKEGAAAGASVSSAVRNADGANALGHGAAEGFTKTSPVAGAASAHERQLAAYVRLAQLEVQRNKSNYKKWNGFMDEMEGVQPVGTIAAELRARAKVGVFPTFENYVQSVKERARRREKALWDYKKQQQKLNGFLEAKDRHTEENMAKVKNTRKNVIMEAHLVQDEIKRRNREHEARRRRMREYRVQVGLSRKEMRAAERHMKRLLRAKEKRFEHDAEELFRQSLKGKIHGMDAAKRWDMKLVRIP
ncbi:uncharacterized protein Tco025E_06142 [Trypanosoma conorhini]|uniref:Uncharacterized protein n=1 Tax=Trypanosoma conorhini TaxID=83891 RepID=A0A3R7MZD4_9TRYP|nr:uncharacterized protein Tco025E_06142 [Trypanosoma conorhini]RNF13553.1 hypothetical protein Tco025E_06142 [Trypanosoma conorhini]